MKIRSGLFCILLFLVVAFPPAYVYEQRSESLGWFKSFTKLFTVKQEDSRYIDVSASHLIIVFGSGFRLESYEVIIRRTLSTSNSL